MPRVSVRVSRSKVVPMLFLVDQHGEVAYRRGRREEEEDGGNMFSVFEWTGDRGLRTPPLAQKIPLIHPRVSEDSGDAPSITIENRSVSIPPPEWKPQARDRPRMKRNETAQDPERLKREMENVALHVTTDALKQYLLRVLRTHLDLDRFLLLRLQRRLKRHPEFRRMHTMRVLEQNERLELEREVRALFAQGAWMQDPLSRGFLVRRVTRKNRKSYFSIDPVRRAIIAMYTSCGYRNAKKFRRARRRDFLRKFDA